MILSIIIPTYNSEKTIIRAIDSCCIDSTNEIEVIVIDDGSQDKTVDIIKKTYDKYILSQKIKLISANHGGAGNARNIGIRKAMGEWIMFLDSDDEFINLKSVFLDFKLLKNNSNIINYSNNIESDGIIRSKNLLEDNLGLVKTDNKIWNSRPSFKAYKQSFLLDNKIFFPVNIKVGEDLVFNLKCLLLTKNVFIKRRIMYKLHDNPYSITHLIVKQDIFEDTVKLVKEVMELDISNYLKKIFIVKNFVAMLIRFLKSNENTKSIILFLKKYKRFFYLKNSFKCFLNLRNIIGFPESLLAWLIWINPSIIKRIFYIIKKLKYS